MQGNQFLTIAGLILILIVVVVFGLWAAGAMLTY